MERDPEVRDALRCATCHALYGTVRGQSEEAATNCPECGSEVWLAAQIPVAEPLTELRC
jgi:peptide subunit release factor 1 (eRF1)